MDKITTYETHPGKLWSIYLNKQRVGTIAKIDGRFRYTPIGAHRSGDWYGSLAACLRSLGS